MSDQEMENLRQEIAENTVKIRNLEDQLKHSIRNPYVNWENLSASIVGGAVMLGIPIFLFLNHFGDDSEGRGKAISGFLAGFIGTGIGAYFYHQSVEAEQNKRWRQHDISSHAVEKVTHRM